VNGPALAPLGAWIAETRERGSIPESALHAAKLQLLDIVAAAHASASMPEMRALLDSLPLGSGTSTEIVTGARLAPASAAFVNACFSMAEDYDDIIWMGHTGHSAVFAALAVAEAEGATARDLLSAIVVANEIAGRLGASSLFGPLNGQMWTFLHLVGAAAATASLLRLDAERATHALAISLSQPPYALQPAFFGPTSKLLAAAIPTQMGILAGYLARNGMTGAPGILEDRRGFWKAFTFQPLPGMLADLGDTWLIETLAIKTVPACHYFQTACEAAEELTKKRPLRVQDVREVLVETNKLGEEVTHFAREYAGPNAPDLSPIGVSFDLGLAVAIVLYAGKLTQVDAAPTWLRANASELRSWYGKIRIAHDPELSLRILDSARAIPAGHRALVTLRARDWVNLVRRYHEHYGSSLVHPGEALAWGKTILGRLVKSGESAVAPKSGPGIPLYFPNRVTIERTDGSKDAVELDLPRGALAREGMEKWLETKFMGALAPRLGETAASKAFAAGMSLENASLAELVRAFAYPAS
jgi:2-methylcitrate dehydratase PrpD